MTNVDQCPPASEWYDRLYDAVRVDVDWQPHSRSIHARTAPRRASGQDAAAEASTGRYPFRSRRGAGFSARRPTDQGSPAGPGATSGNVISVQRVVAPAPEQPLNRVQNAHPHCLPVQVPLVEHGVRLHGCMDSRFVAVLVHEELRGAVNVEVRYRRRYSVRIARAAWRLVARLPAGNARVAARLALSANLAADRHLGLCRRR